MAQAGHTPIISYHSTTAAAVPTAANLAPGELAVNITDGKLYYEDNTNTVQLLASKDAAAGNFTTVDTTNLEVTNIKAKDGTASASIADSTGVFTHATTTVFPAGAVGTPSITTTGDTNTGIFFPAADTIAFAEGGAEVARFDSSGNLGLGTTTPNTIGYGGAVLGIYGGSNTGGNIWLTSDTTAAGNRAGRIGFGTEGNSTNKEIARVLSLAAGSTAGNLGGDLLFSTKPDGGALTERARITSGGNLDLQKNLGLGGASATTSGTGITFPATQSASSDANTLDDYEEGTFTPTISGSTSAGTGTYTTQVGRYTKIGKIVTVQASVYWTAHTGTGNIQITNLPFTAVNVSLFYSVAGIFLQSTTLTAGNYAQAVVIPNTNRIDLYQFPTGGTTTTEVAMDTDAQIIYTVTYETTA